MFAIHKLSYRSQMHGSQFDEVQACVLWEVINYDTLRVILFGADVDEYSKSWIRNGTNSNNIVSVHKAIILPFVYVICCS